QSIALAADALIGAQRRHQALAGLPAAGAPRTLDEGYAIQDTVARHGGATLGYKVGCASKASQALMKTTEPFAGRIFAERVHRSPATVRRADFFVYGVEAEFGFRMAPDQPARAAPYTRDDVAAAVAEVLPVVEICDTRFADWKAVGVAAIVADNAFHGGLVVAPGTTDYRRLDLATHEVVLSIDGAERGRGTGALVLGHPLDSLAWLASDLSRRGQALKRDEIVAAGTCTGLHFITGPAHVVASFGALGEVRFEVVG
ncbi:MAG: hydratase, partial [Proteobacteria bacterium]|nr:hydratase [Pseudomonadota bacterium]